MAKRLTFKKKADNSENRYMIIVIFNHQLKRKSKEMATACMEGDVNDCPVDRNRKNANFLTHIATIQICNLPKTLQLNPKSKRF